jgi:hypothetical protein
MYQACSHKAQINVVWGVARANTAVGASPETFPLLLLQKTMKVDIGQLWLMPGDSLDEVESEIVKPIANA